MKVGFVSLGCSKNLIDTEIAIGILKEHGMEIVSNPEDAEMIVVNTCGFIDPAKEEAINTILEMAEYKKGKCKYLIAMGCLVQRSASIGLLYKSKPYLVVSCAITTNSFIPFLANNFASSIISSSGLLINGPLIKGIAQ